MRAETKVLWCFSRRWTWHGRGAEEGGLPGLLGGALRALLSLVIRPIAWLLATSAAVADSVRTTVTGAAAALPRLRPPRPVPPGLPLPPYDWSEVLPAPACALLSNAAPWAQCGPFGFTWA